MDPYDLYPLILLILVVAGSALLGSALGAAAAILYYFGAAAYRVRGRQARQIITEFPNRARGRRARKDTP